MGTFKDAVDGGKLATAVGILTGQDKALRVEGAKYVVQKGAPNFITGFFKSLNLTDAEILFTLCAERPLDVMKQVIEQVEFPQDALKFAACEPAVFGSPEKMNYLLGKIHHPAYLRYVIQNGVWRLFTINQIDKVPGVLKSLEGQGLLGVNPHDIAIQTVFLEGAERHLEEWTNRYQIHPAINSRTYADALVYAGKTGLQAPFFQTLLTSADLYDLEAISSSKVEGSQNAEFCAAIERAKPNADIGGTRLNVPIMTAWMTERILDKDQSVVIPKDIIHVIISYITTERLPARSNVNENVTSGNKEQGAKTVPELQVPQTVPTSSTLENNLIPLSQSQSPSSGQLVPRTRMSTLNPYQYLIERGNYEEMFELGKMTRYTSL